jgi:hypothetical protein
MRDKRATWSIIDHVAGRRKNPENDVEDGFRIVLIDDVDHIGHDRNTQRRFAPMVVNIDRNHWSTSSESASWQDFLHNPNPVAAALMACMNVCREERVPAKLHSLNLLADLRLDPQRELLVSGFIDTHLNFTGHEATLFDKKLEELSGHRKERVMEIVTSWMKEGC